MIANLEDKEVLFETTNKEWGFYGTMNRELKNDELTAKVFDIAGKELCYALAFIDFDRFARMLDSTYGRHFADAVLSIAKDHSLKELVQAVETTLWKPDRQGRGYMWQKTFLRVV